MGEEKLRIYNVGPGWNPVSFTELSAALTEAREHLENSEIGDMVKVEITEMTQNEYDRLGEHQGW